MFMFIKRVKKMASKRLNVSISVESHRVLEKFMLEKDIKNKDQATEELIKEFGTIKKYARKN